MKPAGGTKGRSRWGGSPRGLSAAHAGAIRSILTGAAPGADLSERATKALEQTRADFPWLGDGATALVPADGGYRWWTFAGLLANAELALRLGGDATPQSLWLAVPEGVVRSQLRQRASTVASGMSPLALQLAENLKFAECLPGQLSARTAAARMTDSAAVARCLAEPMMIAGDG